MGINDNLFKDIYNDCLQIIDNSNDKNILQKRQKLETAYQILCNTKDCEYQEFYSIVHELRIYNYFQSKGIEIKANNDNKIGPDFNTQYGYIECVSTTKGKRGTETRIYVDNLLKGNHNRYKSALPRLSAAIKDKNEKIKQYLQKGVINASSPRIIAVSTAIFSNEFHSDLLIDLAEQILYGIGYMLITSDNYYLETKDEEVLYSHEPVGLKNYSTELNLVYFLQEEFAYTSAIMLTNNSIGEDLNDNNVFFFVNPLAKTPISKDVIEKFKCFCRDESKENLYSWSN